MAFQMLQKMLHAAVCVKSFFLLKQKKWRLRLRVALRLRGVVDSTAPPARGAPPARRG